MSSAKIQPSLLLLLLLLLLFIFHFFFNTALQKHINAHWKFLKYYDSR